MTYFRELMSDARRLLGAQRDLLVISVVAALSIAVSYYRFLRLPGITGDMRVAVEVVGRTLLFLGPPLLSLAILRIPLREIGFGWGEARKWSRDILLAYVIMLPLLVIVSRRPDFRLTYPYLKLSKHGAGAFLLAQSIQLLYMFSWEFICRGYLLFGFLRKIGLPAIAVQALPFILLHIGKPEAEAYTSAIAALVLAVIALRAKSFYPCVILHFAVAASLDVFAVLHI